MKIFINQLILMVICVQFFPTELSFGQTNYFYCNNEKVTMNIRSDQVCIIFSNSIERSTAKEILSNYNIKGEINKINNIGLSAFYILKFNEPKDISNLIRILKTDKNVLWVNPVFERKGTEFKVFNRFVTKLPSKVSEEHIEMLNLKHHVKLIHKGHTGRYTFELGEASDLSVMDMSNLYYQELQAEWSMPDFIVPFKLYVSMGTSKYTGCGHFKMHHPVLA